MSGNSMCLEKEIVCVCTCVLVNLYSAPFSMALSVIIKLYASQKMIQTILMTDEKSKLAKFDQNTTRGFILLSVALQNYSFAW